MATLRDFAQPNREVEKSLLRNFTAVELRSIQRNYCKTCDFDRYDQVRLSLDELSLLWDCLPVDNYAVEELFERPSLRNISVTLVDSENGNAVMRLCFSQPTVMPSRTMHVPDIHEETMDIRFWADMHISTNGGASVDMISAIGASFDADGSEGVFAAPFWASPKTELLEEDPDDLSTLASIYPLLQMALIERPEVFVTEREQEIAIPIQHKKARKNSKNHKVRVVRTIRLNASELPRSTRTYTCPIWNVAGHWRYYKKSDKKVWIGEYQKGRDRNKPDAVPTPREYQLKIPTERKE